MNHSPGNPDLIAAILREIRERGPMPFARFMELALYDPQHGYYTTRARIFGRGGDYYTSTDLHPAFGALLARQAEDIWRALGRPAAFTIAEMGAGRGFLCRDLLEHLREHFADCFSATRYIIDERSPALRAAQMELLSDAGLQSRVAWSQLEDMPEPGIEGLFLSNELVDALPVRRARMTGNGLQEQFVDQSGGELRLGWDAPADRALVEYFAGMNIALQPGQIAEAGLAARDWMRAVAARMRRGFVITIDYGHPADKLYSPARPAGTLACFHEHQASENPLARIGEQDMTAHVNFTALARAGETHGLHTAGFTRQMYFLGSLGIDEFAARAMRSREPGELLKSNMAFRNLIDPAGLGGFGVLVQHRGLDATPQLMGLRIMPRGPCL
jgi:SAM-dependent MidA family methyltransferase